MIPKSVFITDQEHMRNLEAQLRTLSPRHSQRLATYIRRYISPLVVVDLFRKNQLHSLLQESEAPTGSIMIADIRGFTPTMAGYELQGSGLNQVAKRLQDFFDRALSAVFSHGGIMGEFSGDRLMAAFGIPNIDGNHADLALLTAISIYQYAQKMNHALKLGGLHHLSFDVGIGINTGGPVWLGDIGTTWRRELTLLGMPINVASRVEELTKDNDFRAQPGLNILLTGQTLHALSSELRSAIRISAAKTRQLRGVDNQDFEMYKVLAISENELAGLSPYRSSNLDQEDARLLAEEIAEVVESAHQRAMMASVAATMQKVARSISFASNFERVLDAVMQGVQHLLNATTASLLLLDSSTRKLRFAAVLPRGYIDALRKFEDEMVLGRGIVGDIAERGISERIPNAQLDPRFFPHPDSATGFTTRSMLCVPILSEYRTLGVIQVIDEQEDKFSDNDLQILEAIAGFASGAIRTWKSVDYKRSSSSDGEQDHLLAELAHDIRSGVRVIRTNASGQIDLIDKGYLEASNLRASLASIQAQADHLLEYLDHARDFRFGLNATSLKVSEVMDSVLLRMRAEGHFDDSVEVSTDYPENEVEILSDRRRLAAAFGRVISNALRELSFVEHKKLTLSVRPMTDHSVQVRISDTGRGIPSELRPYLFRDSPLPHQMINSSEYGGWGYGLWLTGETIRHLNGAIALDEQQETGTTIIIGLSSLLTAS